MEKQQQQQRKKNPRIFCYDCWLHYIVVTGFPLPHAQRARVRKASINANAMLKTRESREHFICFVPIVHNALAVFPIGPLYVRERVLHIGPAIEMGIYVFANRGKLILSTGKLKMLHHIFQMDVIVVAE